MVGDAVFETQHGTGIIQPEKGLYAMVHLPETMGNHKLQFTPPRPLDALPVNNTGRLEGSDYLIVPPPCQRIKLIQKTILTMHGQRKTDSQKQQFCCPLTPIFSFHTEQLRM